MKPLGALAPQRQDPACARLPASVSLYCVGGAVRDWLLGEASSDRDYLVVGASPELMLAAGFRPVGKDFPVFLHPESQAEYALARTERKSGVGYHGFVFHAGPDVSLEDDLQRRDLTVNAMAVDEQGQLHDPTGGQSDLANHCLRHVSPAFREDPVRLLRLARFLARWPDFRVAPETESLCREIVTQGEAGALVPERVWQEMQRGLSALRPSQMLLFLERVGAWAAVCQSSPPTESLLNRLDASTSAGLGVEIRAGLLFSEASPGPLQAVLPKAVQDWQSLLRRGLVAQLADLLSETPSSEDQAHGSGGTARRILDWCTQADLFRRPERLSGLVCLTGRDRSTCPDRLALIESLLTLSVGPFAQAAAQAGQPVAEAVQQGRLAFLQDRLADKTKNR